MYIITLLTFYKDKNLFPYLHNSINNVMYNCSFRYKSNYFISQSLFLGFLISQLKHYVYCTSFRPLVDRLSWGRVANFTQFYFKFHSSGWRFLGRYMLDVVFSGYLPSAQMIQVPLSTYMLEERGRCRASMFQSVIYSGQGNTGPCL